MTTRYDSVFVGLNRYAETSIVTLNSLNACGPILGMETVGFVGSAVAGVRIEDIQDADVAEPVFVNMIVKRLRPTFRRLANNLLDAA